MGVLSAANRKAVPNVQFSLPGKASLPMDGPRITGKPGQSLKVAPAAFPGAKGKVKRKFPTFGKPSV